MRLKERKRGTKLLKETLMATKNVLLFNNAPLRTEAQHPSDEVNLA
jgi:hypothetical protein